MRKLFTNILKVARQAGSPSFEVDIHSHLIPGIDDGASSMAESLDLIRGLRAMGYQKLITTPHIYQEFYPNTKSSILAGLAELQDALRAEQIDIVVEAAAEYFLDEHFAALLQRDELLTFGENYVLVEMSFFAEPPDLEQQFFELCTKGYRPVLAHPERYLYLGSDLARFQRFREMGVYLQLNALSLLGHYGTSVKKLARLLLTHNQYDFFGTDLHRQEHLRKFKQASLQRKWPRALTEYRFKNELLQASFPSTV